MEEIRRQEAKTKKPPDLTLEEFVKEAWGIVEPAPLVWERHMEELCKHLEAVFNGTIRQLVINVPPGTSKSLIVSVFWPAWVWTKDPSKKWIFGSYADLIVRRDALRMRMLVDSDWYRERWGRLRPDDPDTPWTQNLFVNRKGGLRLSVSTGGQITGFHADIQVVDDPLKPFDVAGAATADAAALKAVLEWWNVTMSTRLTDAEKSARVIVMQRLHEADLAGEMIKTGRYEHLRLPMRYEADNPCKTSVGGDWRTEEGELLAPRRFNEAAVQRLEEALGPAGAAAQLQQRPSPAGGGVFKEPWFIFRWRQVPVGAALLQSWDARFKDDGTSGDFVVGQVWGAVGAEFFLLDQIRGRFSFNQTLQAMRAMSRRWPAARLKLVENKANGPAIADTLKKEIPGIVLVEPEGGKIARANAVAPLWEAGNVFIPAEAEWVPGFIEEHTSFPFGRFDDQVDAASQALLRLSLSSRERYVAAMEALKRSG